MKTTPTNTRAFTLPEILIATVVMSLLSLGLIQLIVASGRLAKSSREQLNAAEIIQSQLESIRSANWDQISSNKFIPQLFWVTNEAVYQGKIRVLRSTISETYRSNLLEVAVEVKWHSDNRMKQLQMSTFFSRYGLSAPPE